MPDASALAAAPAPPPGDPASAACAPGPAPARRLPTSSTSLLTTSADGHQRLVQDAHTCILAAAPTLALEQSHLRAPSPRRSSPPAAKASLAQHAPSPVQPAKVASKLLLSPDDLVHIQQQFVACQDLSHDELAEKAKALVAHALSLSAEHGAVSSELDEANATIARLRAELASLPAFYTSRSQLDHDRLQSENDQLRTQAQALARKLAAVGAPVTAKDKGKGKAGAEYTEDDTASQATEVDGDEDDEEHERDIKKLQSTNRALTADVHHLQLRLETAEQQTQRITHELRSLRAYFLHGSPLVALEHEVALPSPPASQTSPASPPRGKPRCVTLGDAEAELLLHAGKTLSHVNRVNRVPLSSAIARQAKEILHAREHGAYSLPVPPTLSHGDGFDGLMQLANASQEERHDAAGERSSKRLRAPRRIVVDWDETSHADDADWLETPAGALPVPPAQYDAYRFAPPVAGPSHAGAGAGPYYPVGAHPDEDDPDYLPSPPPAAKAAAAAQQGHPHQHTYLPPHPRALGQRLSALDVLAQATAEMDVDVPLVSAGAGVGRKKPPVTGSKSRVPAVGPDGEKKPRSPYIKWNIQEDEQLLRAVIQVGCAWDSVAKLCPTRAYHQVRQRFLRGLRSGEQLPKQLLHLQEAVRKSVREYDAKKKRKRLAKQAAQEIADATRE